MPILAPVKFLNNRVEDREPWKKPSHRARPHRKKQEEPAPASTAKTGEHIDIKA